MKNHKTLYEIYGGKVEKTESVRIDIKLLKRVRMRADKNGRSTKMEMERMLETQIKNDSPSP